MLRKVISFDRHYDLILRANMTKSFLRISTRKESVQNQINPWRAMASHKINRNVLLLEQM